MGNVTSIDKTLKISQISKDITKTDIKNKQDVAAETIQTVNQEVKFAKSSVIEGCDINIANTVDLDVTVSSVLDVDTIVESRGKVANKLAANANTFIENNYESLNTAFGNKQKMKESVSQEVENITKNVFKKENIQKVMNKAIQLVGQKVVFRGVIICNEDGKIDVEQNVAAKIVMDTLLRDVTSQLKETDVYNELEIDSMSSAKSENTGLLGDLGRAWTSVIDSVGGIVTGPLMSLVVFAGSGLIVALVVFLLLGQSPAGQNAIRSTTGAGMMGPPPMY